MLEHVRARKQRTSLALNCVNLNCIAQMLRAQLYSKQDHGTCKPVHNFAIGNVGCMIPDTRAHDLVLHGHSGFDDKTCRTNGNGEAHVSQSVNATAPHQHQTPSPSTSQPQRPSTAFDLPADSGRPAVDSKQRELEQQQQIYLQIKQQQRQQSRDAAASSSWAVLWTTDTADHDSDSVSHLAYAHSLPGLPGGEGHGGW